jgi:hypothetical protein
MQFEVLVLPYPHVATHNKRVLYWWTGKKEGGGGWQNSLHICQIGQIGQIYFQISVWVPGARVRLHQLFISILLSILAPRILV